MVHAGKLFLPRFLTHVAEHGMKVQLAKEYYKPYLAATEPMFIKPRQFEMFNRMPPGWATAKAENFGKA